MTKIIFWWETVSRAVKEGEGAMKKGKNGGLERQENAAPIKGGLLGQENAAKKRKENATKKRKENAAPSVKIPKLPLDWTP